MTHTIVQADIFTAAHRISCRIPVGPTGLLTTLNDTTLSVVDAANAYMSRLEEPAKIVNHFDFISLPKANIAFVILGRREDVGPQGVARGGYTHVLSRPVIITLPPFELNGAIETPGKLDASALLVGGTGRFMPLYQATATAIPHQEQHYSGPVMLVNRTLVASLAPETAKGTS